MILSKRFENAAIYVTRHHISQKRKGTDIPYISHLLAVAGIALDYGADEDEAIAALLHDTIEDSGDKGAAAVREDIRNLFGKRVLEIVEGCTDADVVPKPPWRTRKEAYIKHLRDAPPAVRLVSAADKLHNARSILRDYRELGEALWPRFTGGKKGTLWYYRELVTVFQSGGRTPLADELERVVTEIEKLAS